MADPQRAAPQGVEFERFAEFYQNSVYAAFPQEHRSGGSFGQSVFQVEQEPIDLVDSAVSDFIVCVGLAAMDQVGIDVGDGVRAHANVQPGHVALYPAGAEARTIVSCPHKICNFTLPQDQVDAWLEDAGVGYDPFAAFYGRMGPAPRIAALVQSIWRAAEAPSGADRLMIDGLTMQLLAELTAQGRDHLSMADHTARTDRRVERAVEYIEANLAAPLGVTELAAVACLSPSHFARAFKSATGETVWSYVRRRRVESAHELLVASEASIADISQRCGFADASHLTRAVKASYEATPGQLRASARL